MKRIIVPLFVVLSVLLTGIIVALRWAKDDLKPTKSDQVEGYSSPVLSSFNDEEQGALSEESGLAPRQERDPALPEPPGRPWKCVYNQEIPTHLHNGPLSREEVPRGRLEPDVPDSTLRNANVEIPFAELESVIRLDEFHRVFEWIATEEALSAISRDHQPIVQPAFDAADLSTNSHYVFSIHHSVSGERSIVSVPMPADLMVEVQREQDPRAPGRVAVNTRKEGDAHPKPGWLIFSFNE
jgi:hypothetical protein